MRAVALVLFATTIGCSAVDDFSRFTFVSDGGGDMVARDGGADDLARVDHGGIGDACTATSCATGLTCYTTAGTATLPGGFCSRTCDPNASGNCPFGSECGTVEGFSMCLPRCDPSQNLGCRQSYSCCHMQLIVVGPGACAPTSSNYCGG